MKTHTYFKRIESGRSMIEMLGVLAIIGIIAISGVNAYTYARQQIGLNKLTNIMTLAIMSIDEEHPIYDSFLNESGKFASSVHETKVKTTDLFAKTYGFKTKDNAISLTPNVSVNVSTGDSSNSKIDKNTFSINFIWKDLSPNNDSEKQVVRLFLERARDTIKSNPILRNRFYRIYSYPSTIQNIQNRTDAEIDAAFDAFINSDKLIGIRSVNNLFFTY